MHDSDAVAPDTVSQPSVSERIGYGLLFGALTAIVVSALTYVANLLAGLAFPPFSLFDFMTRILPGTVVTASIDTIVKVIRGLQLGSTATMAKLVEQSIALLLFIFLGALFGSLLGILSRGESPSRLPAYGLGIGLLIGVLVLGAELYVGVTTVGIAVSLVWLAIVFGGWGLVLGTLLGNALAVSSQVERGEMARRNLLLTGGTALAAIIAGGLGLGFLMRERRSSRPPQPVPTPSSTETSGAAAAPPQTALSQRIDPVTGTRSEITPSDDFYRIDINTLPPDISADGWHLEIDGLVDQPAAMTLQDLREWPAVSQYITLSCISNPVGGDLISTALWTGVRLKDLLEQIGLQADARALRIEAQDGFYETVVMDDLMDERTLLVYAMNGELLPQEHGFPLRIYIPNRYGMKQPKWIVRMTAVADEPPGYWVDRGWSRTAIMQTTSVIDAVQVESDGNGGVEIGGIAHAGDRGISRVEVQIDDGTWQEAELRAPPLSPLTWVQWRIADYNVTPGHHVAKVRAYDGSGDLQVAEPSPPHPNGATGIDTYTF